MSLDVLSALELEKTGLAGKFLLIKEWSGCEATFVISCLLSKELKEKRTVCLVVSHYEIGHYHNIGFKLGYNLKEKIDEGKVIVVDSIAHIKNDGVLGLVENGGALSDSEDYLNNIYKKIDEAVKRNSTSGITVMFDGFTHFLDLGYDLRLLNLLVQRIKTLINENKCCALVLNTHLSCEESLDTQLSNILHYLSHVVCEVKPLSTGISSHISGHLKFIKRGPNLESIERNYHYKLLDRGVKVFSPGV